MLVLDATTFPALRLPGVGLDVGLLPVTRAQFDYFLGEPSGFPADVLAELTQASPRATWRRVSADRPEGVFLTAVRPDEAERFAAWLGDGWRLPTPDEWRACDAAARRLGTEVGVYRQAADDPRVHPAARALIEWAVGRGPPSAARAGLWDGGLLEWVALPGGGHGLLGRPRPGLIALVLNPQAHDPVRPTTPARHPAFGARLVRPTPGEAA